MSGDLTLAVEGSTYAGSVALIRENVVIAEAMLPVSDKPGRGGREEQFMPMIARCMQEAGAGVDDLTRVVCGAGPGSFTSLRVAASIAKGIAVGRNIPLFAVSSLLLIVASDDAGDGRWLALLPAMRGELFAGLFEVSQDRIDEVEPPRIIAEGDVDAECRRLNARAIGPVAHGDRHPQARGVARVMNSVIRSGACDVASWEPVYGRLAEAQVRWEAAHGRPLTAAE